MIDHKTNKGRLILSVIFVIIAVVIMLVFSPFQNPVLIPVLLAIGLVAIALLVKSISVLVGFKISNSSLLAVVGVTVVLFSLHSLHQLRVWDVALVVGLLLLLSLYSKR